MDGSEVYILRESDAFRITIIFLEVTGFVLVALLLCTTALLHISRHPVITAMLVTLLLHAALYIWPGIYDKPLSRDIITGYTLETATSLVVFCAADAVLLRYVQVVEAAFSVSFMATVMRLARRALDAAELEPQERDQRQPESILWIALLCFGPFIWAMPVLFAPIPFLMKRDARIVNYFTLYCDIPSESFHSVCLVFVLLPFVVSILFLGYIASYLMRIYQRHRDVVSSTLDVPLLRSFAIMALTILISTILLIINASSNFSAKGLVGLLIFWESLLPLVQFSVFAWQGGVCVIWYNFVRCRGFSTGSEASSPTYTMQYRNNAATGVTYAPTERPLPPPPSDEVISISASRHDLPPPSDHAVYQGHLPINLPGSRLSLQNLLLRIRTPTPTPHVLTNIGKSAHSEPDGRSILDRGDGPLAASPDSATMPLVTPSRPQWKAQATSTPAALLPQPSGSQQMFSPGRTHPPQRFPSRPVSLPPPRVRTNRRFSGPPGSFLFAPQSMRTLLIPPPPALPAPTAPPSSAPSESGRSASRPVSMASSKLSHTTSTTRSSETRSFLSRLEPRSSRRSAAAPRRSMREIISQFPQSPKLPPVPLPVPLSPPAPAPALLRDSVTMSPMHEVIQLREPSPPLNDRVDTIDRRMVLSRDSVLTAASVPPRHQRSQSETTLPEPPRRDSVRASRRRTTVIGAVPATPPDEQHPEDSAPVISPPTMRPHFVAPLSPRRVSAAMSLASVDGLPPPRRSRDFVPPPPPVPPKTWL
ncbi:hypothetical protein AURDEDRAFT_155584 [Auricularia subglabra TFB-10046 SS5]|nr:hypothetical protein AURDEDRAFT_155584 [Auricularia subglabra TFB-10046 SS5]